MLAQKWHRHQLVTDLWVQPKSHLTHASSKLGTPPPKCMTASHARPQRAGREQVTRTLATPRVNRATSSGPPDFRLVICALRARRHGGRGSSTVWGEIVVMQNPVKRAHGNHPRPGCAESREQEPRPPDDGSGCAWDSTQALWRARQCHVGQRKVGHEQVTLLVSVLFHQAQAGSRCGASRYGATTGCPLVSPSCSSPIAGACAAVASRIQRTSGDAGQA